jgi:potassium voltage-gated channel Shab-related subfamily B member 1
MIGLALSTLPDFHTRDETGHEVDHVHLAYLEAVCIGWFTLEYVARLIASPDLSRFLKGFLNCIDLIVILPYYISLTFDLLSFKADQFHDVRRSLQTLRMVRILRILKLVRHSTGLQSIGYTFKRSYKEFGLLLMFIVIGMMTFSTLVYFAENSSSHNNSKKKNNITREPGDELDGFDSIPSTMWWAVITMTTVGYGDVYPNTPWGKLVGAICSTSNFGEFYKEQKRRQKMLERRQGLDVLRQPDESVPLTCTAGRCSSDPVETVSPVNGRSLRNSIIP